MSERECDDVLSQTKRIQLDAASLGFDWPDVAGPLAKLAEEVEELRQAVEQGDPERIRDELGDVLFSAVNVSRHVPADATTSLEHANEKFLRRWKTVREAVQSAGHDLNELSLDELDAHWNTAKQGSESAHEEMG